MPVDASVLEDPNVVPDATPENGTKMRPSNTEFTEDHPAGQDVALKKAMDPVGMRRALLGMAEPNDLHTRASLNGRPSVDVPVVPVAYWFCGTDTPDIPEPVLCLPTYMSTLALEKCEWLSNPTVD